LGRGGRGMVKELGCEKGDLVEGWGQRGSRFEGLPRGVNGDI
jgi:hypothetical protein